MAIAQRVLYELVGVDRASPAFARAGDSALAAEGKLSRFGKTIVKVGAGFAAVAGVVGVESVKMATTFQSSMEKIRTQTGASQKEVNRMSAAVLKLGKYAEQSPQQLADSLYHLESVGLRGAKALRALKTASDLAAVGGADLEATTSALGGAWRSGIKGAQNFGKAAATLNAIVGAGNMRMDDLVAAMGTGFLSTARTFGLSLKSVGSALALMTDEGTPAQAAATRLRMSISLLGAPSQAAAKQLATIGLSSTALANAMRGPQGIVGAIGLLKSHLDASGLSATKQAQLLSRAFGGGRSSAAILLMVNQLDTLRKKQEQINRTTGNYGKAVQEQRKTAQAQFALLKSSLDVMMVKIGSHLLPVMVSLTKWANNHLLPAVITVAHAFASIIPVAAIKRDWKTIEGIIAGASGKNLSPSRVKAGGKVMPNLAGAAKAPAGYQIGQQIRTAISGGITHLDWGKLAGLLVHGLLGALGKINWWELGKKAAFMAVPFALSLIGNLVSALITTAIHHPLDMLLLIASLFPVGKLLTAAGKILEALPFLKVLAPLTKGLGGAMEKLGGWFWKALGKLLKFVFGPILKRIEPFFAGAVGWLKGKGDSIILGLWYGLEKAWRTVTGWLGKIGGKILGYFGKAGSWLLSKGRDIISGLWSGIKDMWRSVSSWLGGVAGRVWHFFARTGRWLLSAGGNLVLGFLRGIRAKMAGIWSWIRGNIVNPVINAVKHWFGIKSPSTVMHGIGFNLIAGLIRGIISNNPVSAIRRIFGSLPKALGHMVDKGLVAIGSLPGKALKALGGLGGFLGKLFGIGGGGGPAMSIGQKMAAAMGWTGAQWNALKALWTGESGWRWNARNPSSGAYGIPQALPASKMASAGRDWLTNPATQIRWGLGYIKSVYGSPLAAYSAWLGRSPHWYGKGLKGGIFASPTLIGVGEKGAERVDITPLGGDGAATQPINIRVFIGDREITDIVGVEMDKRDAEDLRWINAGTGAH